LEVRAAVVANQHRKEASMAHSHSTDAPVRSVTILPTAAAAPVVQTRRAGRYPACVTRIGRATAPARLVPPAWAGTAAQPLLGKADGGQGADTVIAAALQLLETRLRTPSAMFTSTSDVQAYARLRIGAERREVVAAMFLNAQYGLIAFEPLFRGSLSECHVQPREIARRALEQDARAVILAHNHPSGTLKPSSHDIHMTNTIHDVLRLIDVVLVDHVIVSPRGAVSLLDLGLLPGRT
jgi:DNA repair protein RadC